MKKREGARRALSRKHLEEVIKKKEMSKVVCASLQNDADQLAEQAENKSSTFMAHMIKSNTLRKRYWDKCSELKNVKSELEAIASDLRHMP